MQKNEQHVEDEAEAEAEELNEIEIPSDEAEVLPAEEVYKSDIATDTEPSEDEGHLTQLVCDSCLELNLLTKSAIECGRCGKAFCLHFASTVDAQYCVNCMSDISVTKQIITKVTHEITDSKTGEVSFYRRRAREVKIGGLDWLFAQRKIGELSDVELDLAIEYHRNICSLMIAEAERRRNAWIHRNAGIKIQIPKTPATTSVSESTSTTVKKTKTVSKNKASEQLAALLKSMETKGVNINKIAEMLKK